MSKIVEKYEELKQVDSSKLYLFKSGKFYIFIGDDCDYINEYIVLKKTKFSGDYCKCGFPVDSIDNYLRVFNNHNLNIEIITDFHVDNSKKGYLKNPTATNIVDSVSNNKIYLKDSKQPADGIYIYVVDEKNNLIFGKRKNPLGGNKSPHPSLIGGKNPKVKVAGEITFHHGKIYEIDVNSGHYKPNVKSLKKAENILYSNFNNNMFSKNSRLRRRDK
ncbi:MAG TPA: hypothetical protein PLC25_02360 [Bacilli bacterium]|nr:hypothetical protein [Bacilli bacterium]